MWKHKILNGQTAAMKKTKPWQTLHDYQDMVRRIAVVLADRKAKAEAHERRRREVEEKIQKARMHA